MSVLLVRHELSFANDKNSAAFGQAHATLLPEGAERAPGIGVTLTEHYGIDPATEAAAASMMYRSEQTAELSGFITIRNYAVLNEVDVPKTPELRAALDRKEVIPEAREAAEAVLADPPAEKVWFTHGYLMAALCELTGVDTSGLRFIPRFGEIRELPIRPGSANAAEQRPGHIPITPDPATAQRLARILGAQGEAGRNPAELLLYINPSAAISAEPNADEITQKMVAAFRSAEETGTRWRGVHQCACGACSDNTDYILPSGHQTNSLAVHYLALHRDEVPPDQLEIVEGFDSGLAEPSAEDLNIPENRTRIDIPRFR